MLFLLTSWNLLSNNNDYNHLTYFYTCHLNSHFSFIKDLDKKNMKFLLHFIYFTSLKFPTHSQVWNTGKNLLQNINFMISRRLQPRTVYLLFCFFPFFTVTRKVLATQNNVSVLMFYAGHYLNGSHDLHSSFPKVILK